MRKAIVREITQITEAFNLARVQGRELFNRVHVQRGGLRDMYLSFGFVLEPFQDLM